MMWPYYSSIPSPYSYQDLVMAKKTVILGVFEVFNKTIILSHQVYFESDQIYKLMLLYQTLIPEKNRGNLPETSIILKNIIVPKLKLNHSFILMQYVDSVLFFLLLQKSKKFTLCSILEQDSSLFKRFLRY